MGNVLQRGSESDVLENTPQVSWGNFWAGGNQPHPCFLSSSVLTTHKLTVSENRPEEGEAGNNSAGREAAPDSVYRKLPWR